MIVAAILFVLSIAGTWYARELARGSRFADTETRTRVLREHALFTQGVSSGCLIGTVLITTGEIIAWLAG